MNTVMPFMPGGDRMTIGIGDECEVVQRAAAAQILLNLEDQVQLQEALWLPRDQHFAEVMNRAPVRTRIERVPSERIFTGLKPSLVESSFDLWPAIAVRCHDSAPRAGEQPDQYDSLTLQLVVEVMCKVGPFTDVTRAHDPEEAMDRQLQRMAGAVHRCISLDPSLGGTVGTIEAPPRRQTGLPFARKLDKGAGAETLFQGSSLTYAVTKYAL